MGSTNFRYQFHLYWYKVALIIITFFCLSQSAQAQMFRINHDDKKLYFGIMMGYNNSNFRIEPSEYFVNNDSILTVLGPKGRGFNLGIITNLKLAKHLDLRFTPGVAFSNRPLEYKQIGNFTEVKRIESVLLQAPIWLKFKSDRYNNFRFYVLGGARLDYDLASNSKKRKADDIVKLGRFDLSADYGIGVQIFFPLFIFSPEITISQGLPNIHVPSPTLNYSNVLNKLFSRTIMFKLQFEG